MGRKDLATSPRLWGEVEIREANFGRGGLSACLLVDRVPLPKPLPAKRRGEEFIEFLLRRLRSLQRRIIRISLGAPAVERRLVPLVQRRAASQPLDQIGIRNER